MRKYSIIALITNVIFLPYSSATMINNDVFSEEIEKTKNHLSILEKLHQQEFLNKDEIKIEYKGCAICDFKTSFTHHYSNVLEEIEKYIEPFSGYPKPIYIDFSMNYLQDEGIKSISKFILSNNYIKNNIKKIDFSNNRFTNKSISSICQLVKCCPNMETLDISINYIDYSTLNIEIESLEKKEKNKIIFSIY